MGLAPANGDDLDPGPVQETPSDFFAVQSRNWEERFGSVFERE